LTFSADNWNNAGSDNRLMRKDRVNVPIEAISDIREDLTANYGRIGPWIDNGTGFTVRFMDI
jgi:hypothetical protein